MDRPGRRPESLGIPARAAAANPPIPHARHSRQTLPGFRAGGRLRLGANAKPQAVE